MSDLSDQARKAMTYWGEIQAAASEGMTTADLWSLIQDAAEEMGLESPGVTIRGVSELRGLAGRIIASGRTFATAGPEISLSGRDWAEAPWSRPLAEQNALGIWQVRFQHTTLGPDGPETQWRTSVFTGSVPGTVGELRSALEEDAQAMATKYGVGHIGFDNVQLLVV